MIKKALVLGALTLSLLAGAPQKAWTQTKEENNMSRILIAYYSYSGNTKQVAEAIQDKIGGDLFEIQTNHTYPAEYRAMTDQVKKEISEKFRPELTTKVADMKQYDTVFIGSPNWWGTIAPAVDSFIESYDLKGKKIVPFITNGGGGVQNTVKDLTAVCQGCRVETNAWAGYGNDTAGLDRWLTQITAQK